MLIVYGYSKCSTVKKTISFLQKNQISYQHIDNVSNKLTKEQIKELYLISKTNDIKKLFNTSGIRYRELNLKDTLKDANLEKALELLSSDGMLVKRPLITNGKNLVIGYKEDQIKNL